MEIQSSSFLEKSLAGIVSEDSRAADVFDRLGLDYCCHGQQALQDAAIDRGVPVSDVIDELVKLGAPLQGESAAEKWTDLAALTRYIVEQHHGYVRQASPRISAWLNKLVARHGTRHPELSQVSETFEELAAELLMHMMKEEHVLFPFIDELAAAWRRRGTSPSSAFGTVLNPIRMMEHEHEEAGNLLQRLRRLTADYQPPPDACTTYDLCYRELARYEADLHRHIHLENNVLFPGAISIEEGLI